MRKIANGIKSKDVDGESCPWQRQYAQTTRTTFSAGSFDLYNDKALMVAD